MLACPWLQVWETDCPLLLGACPGSYITNCDALPIAHNGPGSGESHIVRGHLPLVYCSQVRSMSQTSASLSMRRLRFPRGAISGGPPPSSHRYKQPCNLPRTSTKQKWIATTSPGFFFFFFFIPSRQGFPCSCPGTHWLASNSEISPSLLPKCWDQRREPPMLTPPLFFFSWVLTVPWGPRANQHQPPGWDPHTISSVCVEGGGW